MVERRVVGHAACQQGVLHEPGVGGLKVVGRVGGVGDQLVDVVDLLVVEGPVVYEGVGAGVELLPLGFEERIEVWLQQGHGEVGRVFAEVHLCMVVDVGAHLAFQVSGDVLGVVLEVDGGVVHRRVTKVREFLGYLGRLGRELRWVELLGQDAVFLVFGDVLAHDLDGGAGQFGIAAVEYAGFLEGIQPCPVDCGVGVAEAGLRVEGHVVHQVLEGVVRGLLQAG